MAKLIESYQIHEISYSIFYPKLFLIKKLHIHIGS